MKKLIALLLCVLMVGSVFAGCAKQDNTTTPADTQTPADAQTPADTQAPADAQTPADSGAASDGKEVTVTWGVFETDNITADVYARIIEAFEADNPGIKIEKVLATGDSRPAFWKTLIASGTAPDIITEANILASTEGLFAEVPENIQGLFDPATLCTYNGKCVTVPNMKQLRIQMYYNKADFAEAGVEEPQTWDEFLEVCEKLKDAGKVPLICGGTGDIWATGLWWIAATNQSIMEKYPNFNQDLKEGKVGWNDPVVAESLENWKTLIDAGYYHDGCMSYSYSQAATEFQNGAASMMLDGSWAAAGFDAAGNEGFGVFCLPSPDGLTTYCTDVGYWGVTEQSKNKEAAFQFIEYYFSHPEVNQILLEADGWSSTTKEPVTYEQGPLMTKFVENLSDWTLVPEIVKVTGDYAIPAGFQDEVDKMLQNVFVGKDIQAELDALQSQYEIVKDQ